MSASVIALNRENNGICAEPCSHLDCIAAKQIAVERCRICKAHIGFEQPFYSEVAARVHKRCLESELAKKLQTDVELRFLTVEEVASLLRVEVGTVRNWVSQNKIPYRKFFVPAQGPRHAVGRLCSQNQGTRRPCANGTMLRAPHI